MSIHFLNLKRYLIKASLFLVSIILLTTTLARPVFAQYTTGIYGVAASILGIINGVLIPLIFAIAFIVFLWGIFKYFIASGANPEERVKGKSLLMYGLIGFAVMLSLWGLVNIAVNTFGLGGVQHLPLPYI